MRHIWVEYDDGFGSVLSVRCRLGLVRHGQQEEGHVGGTLGGKIRTGDGHLGVTAVETFFIHRCNHPPRSSQISHLMIKIDCAPL